MSGDPVKIRVKYISPSGFPGTKEYGYEWRENVKPFVGQLVMTNNGVAVISGIGCDYNGRLQGAVRIKV